MYSKIIIELKYIKKKDYNKKIMTAKKEEGIKQLIEYSKDERINKNSKKYLVIFVGNELKILESVE